MITFLICFAVLVGAYFIYGHYLERTIGADPDREPPCRSRYDGVDYLPLPKWKTFLIQLLNIAGLGPIFGALLGAMYGPVAFLWITLGGILIGGLHDYVSGMISMKMGGLSLPEIVGRYLGPVMKQSMRAVTLLLMVLVGAVFLVGPAGILQGMTGMNQSTWIWIILLYYILATLLPIDKIIGRIYPLFGAALFFMALGILYVLLFDAYTIPELSAGNWHNFKTDAARFPIFPTLFITIACGAVSGFHATQSPLMARCLQNEQQGKPVFFGAMISESLIALVWAAAGMAFWGGPEELNTTLAEHGDNAAWAVNEITRTTARQIRRRTGSAGRGRRTDHQRGFGLPKRPADRRRFPAPRATCDPAAALHQHSAVRRGVRDYADEFRRHLAILRLGQPDPRGRDAMDDHGLSGRPA